MRFMLFDEAFVFGPHNLPNFFASQEIEGHF